MNDNNIKTVLFRETLAAEKAVSSAVKIHGILGSEYQIKAAQLAALYSVISTCGREDEYKTFRRNSRWEGK